MSSPVEEFATLDVETARSRVESIARAFRKAVNRDRGAGWLKSRIQDVVAILRALDRRNDLEEFRGGSLGFLRSVVNTHTNPRINYEMRVSQTIDLARTFAPPENLQPRPPPSPTKEPEPSHALHQRTKNLADEADRSTQSRDNLLQQPLQANPVNPLLKVGPPRKYAAAYQLQKSVPLEPKVATAQPSALDAPPSPPASSASTHSEYLPMRSSSKGKRKQDDDDYVDPPQGFLQGNDQPVPIRRSNRKPPPAPLPRPSSSKRPPPTSESHSTEDENEVSRSETTPPKKKIKLATKSRPAPPPREEVPSPVFNEGEDELSPSESSPPPKKKKTKPATKSRPGPPPRDEVLGSVLDIPCTRCVNDAVVCRSNPDPTKSACQTCSRRKVKCNLSLPNVRMERLEERMKSLEEGQSKLLQGVSWIQEALDVLAKMGMKTPSLTGHVTLARLQGALGDLRPSNGVNSARGPTNPAFPHGRGANHNQEDLLNDTASDLTTETHTPAHNLSSTLVIPQVSIPSSVSLDVPEMRATAGMSTLSTQPPRAIVPDAALLSTTPPDSANVVHSLPPSSLPHKLGEVSSLDPLASETSVPSLTRSNAANPTSPNDTEFSGPSNARLVSPSLLSTIIDHPPPPSDLAPQHGRYCDPSTGLIVDDQVAQPPATISSQALELSATQSTGSIVDDRVAQPPATISSDVTAPSVAGDIEMSNPNDLPPSALSTPPSSPPPPPPPPPPRSVDVLNDKSCSLIFHVLRLHPFWRLPLDGVRLRFTPAVLRSQRKYLDPFDKPTVILVILDGKICEVGRFRFLDDVHTIYSNMASYLINNHTNTPYVLNTDRFIWNRRQATRVFHPSHPRGLAARTLSFLIL
ncbi:hypothetical protein ONZ45_g12444 [Pleurotus djamor]|nr:hypothetical protein ONZ45_g12444 [Pleurotus djamor]